VPSLAELVDAVVGIDTHRDTHEAEIADATGSPIATLTISNDDAGFASLLRWITRHAPGPRVAVSVEGTRSYGIGVARALAAAGVLVLECEQPHRAQRRGKGKSDPIDAHLAVLAALRLDADLLPAVRADGDREALRILLAARQDIVTAATAQTNRLRALLLTGDDIDRRAARSTLTDVSLTALARRRVRGEASRAEAIRQGEIRRLALALREAERELKVNRKQLQTIVDDLAAGLTAHYGIGPISAAQAIVSFSHPGRCRNEAAFAALAGTSPLPAQQRPYHPPPAQPRRRPRPEPGLAHNRADPHPQLPPNPRLRRPPYRRRQKSSRNQTLHQALHRPRALPHPHPCNAAADGPYHRLTNIEASSLGTPASEGSSGYSMRSRPVICSGEYRFSRSFSTAARNARFTASFAGLGRDAR